MLIRIALATFISLSISVTLIHCLIDKHDQHASHKMGDFMYHYRDKHPCQRECIEGAAPMTCYYSFHIEWYYTMSKACFDCPYNITDCDRLHCIPGDGMKRAITVINRQMPGPAVEVCVGDHIIVDLHNGLMEESTSIHWHGHHQVDSPYMDGVPHLTQCPIPPRTTFRYRFQADSPGTHFWHSHTGSQRGDGSYGAFIIRKPDKREAHRHLYEFDLPEHTMVVTDWSHVLGVEMFNAHHHSDGDNKPPTILMNGKGLYKSFPIPGQPEHVTSTPVEVFTVKKGHTYRFRLINAGYLNCPVQLSIDNHTLTAISSDGGDIKPVTADSLVSYAGERWDFILHATSDISSYWIKMRGLMDCDERFTSAFQVAILRYEGAKIEDPPGVIDYNGSKRSGMVLNPLNTPSKQNDSILISELSTIKSVANDLRLREEPDMKLFVSYDFYDLDNPHFHLSNMYGFNQVLLRTEKVRTPQLNHLSFKFPSYPLLSQRDEVDESMFCSNITDTTCNNTYCECTNVIHVPLHAIVELILIDEGRAYDANHPFHLHGHPFRVVAMERVAKNVTRQQIMDLDAKGLIKRNLHSAPLKDTVTVPDGGYTVMRFHATNPGYWLFHCHIEFHVETGMALVFKVGEHSDMAPVPKNFPKCNNYLYDLDEEDISDYNDAHVQKNEINHVKSINEEDDDDNDNDEVTEESSLEIDNDTIPKETDLKINKNLYNTNTVAEYIRDHKETSKNKNEDEIVKVTIIRADDEDNKMNNTKINIIDNNNNIKPKESFISKISKTNKNKTNNINTYEIQTLQSNNTEGNYLSVLDDGERNNNEYIPLDEDDSDRINNKTEDSKSNELYRKVYRILRSTTEIFEKDSLSMKPTYLIVAGSLLLISIVLVFSLYKFCR